MESPVGALALSWCSDRVSGTISISAVRLLVTRTSHGRRYRGSWASCAGQHSGQCNRQPGRVPGDSGPGLNAASEVH